MRAFTRTLFIPGTSTIVAFSFFSQLIGEINIQQAARRKSDMYFFETYMTLGSVLVTKGDKATQTGR